METLNKAQVATIEAAGFKVGQDGKVREGGRLIKEAEIEQVLLGNIVASVDMSKLKKDRQKAAKKTVSLSAALDSISPAIGLLRVGKTARVPIPKDRDDGKDPVRAFVMGIVTKLNHITAVGGEWPGRKFDTMSDDTKSFVYISRLPDGEAHTRRVGGGGGRRKKVDGTPTTAASNLTAALAQSREHLNGAGEAQQVQEQTDAVLNGGVAESGADGPAATDQNPSEQQEDATIVRS